MASVHLARWACSLKYADLPPEVIRAAVESFYNYAGCAIAGSDHAAVTIAHKALSPFFGEAKCSLLGSVGKLRTDAQHAALLNGISSHVLDYDDTHLDKFIHPTGPVASALLAVADWKGNISGKDFLLALVAGVETECKLGLSVWPDHYDAGWHNTSTTGSIGAAVAVAKLLSLSALQTTHAIGIAATQVTGLREMWGSHTKSFHIGRAAQNGLLAALLAQGGFTSTEYVLEAKRGWVNVVAVTKENRQEDLAKFLGMGNADHNLGLAGSGGAKGQWEILFNSFKPYPCGIVIHPIIDACSQLRSTLLAKGLDASAVASVFMRVHPLTIELTGKRTPRDGLEAKFSVYHGAAIGLLYGKGSLAQYQDSVAQDPVVINLRDRSDAVADTSIAPDEVRVTLTMKDGTKIEKHLLHALGSVDRPMTKEQLTEKFKDQSARFLGDKVDSASEALWDIEHAANVSQVMRVL